MEARTKGERRCKSHDVSSPFPIHGVRTADKPKSFPSLRLLLHLCLICHPRWAVPAVPHLIILILPVLPLSLSLSLSTGTRCDFLTCHGGGPTKSVSRVSKTRLRRKWLERPGWTGDSLRQYHANYRGRNTSIQSIKRVHTARQRNIAPSSEWMRQESVPHGEATLPLFCS